MTTEFNPQEWASMMSEAATQAQPEAPYGYTTDKDSGEQRPKKAPGRPRRSPTIDELKTEKESEPAEPVETEPVDIAPAPPPKRGRSKKPKPVIHDKDVPMPVKGFIARKVNGLYFQAGKIIRGMDHDIGTAVIGITRKESEDDLTVGEAWEDLARTNPRIRKFLLSLVKGTGWGALIWAHMPVFLAILMKESVRNHIPFGSILGSYAEPDEDAAPGEGGLPGGMTMDDLGQMMTLAQGMMSQMGHQA